MHELASATLIQPLEAVQHLRKHVEQYTSFLRDSQTDSIELVVRIRYP